MWIVSYNNSLLGAFYTRNSAVRFTEDLYWEQGIYATFVYQPLEKE